MTLLEQALKKYQDYQIDNNLLEQMLKEIQENTKLGKTNISKDFILLQELDKKICLYLKEQILLDNIDYAILLVEKYKYILDKINVPLTNIEKEELLLKIIKSYKGKEIFSIYILNYTKKKFMKLKENNKTIDLNKLKKLVRNTKNIEQNVDNLSILYKYFYDVEDVLLSNYCLEEKLIILLHFGYIDSKFIDENTISDMLNLNIDFICSVINNCKEKLELVYEQNLLEHTLSK